MDSRPTRALYPVLVLIFCSCCLIVEDDGTLTILSFSKHIHNKFLVCSVSLSSSFSRSIICLVIVLYLRVLIMYFFQHIYFCFSCKFFFLFYSSAKSLSELFSFVSSFSNVSRRRVMSARFLASVFW